MLFRSLGTGSLVKLSGEHGKDRTVVIDKLVGPYGLTWAGNDAVYLSEVFAGMISRIDLKTGQKTVIASGLKFPEGIDTAPDGKIIVAEVGLKQLISIDPASGAVTKIAGGLKIGFPGTPGLLPSGIPTGVGVSSDGAIYVTSDIENAIYKFTPVN